MTLPYLHISYFKSISLYFIVIEDRYLLPEKPSNPNSLACSHMNFFATLCWPISGIHKNLFYKSAGMKKRYIQHIVQSIIWDIWSAHYSQCISNCSRSTEFPFSHLARLSDNKPTSLLFQMAD